ncbi:class I SAM-dependent methyltransferase [Patulibacter americanus]|uniref:class I SAM-dependent methyltransferase n=1 Tax=Patulibacter americanus TaxID=588672 RepID=UPI0009FD3D7C|nr:class I SAM-dependent methyltransferase [Patulibacter americanus]
MPQNDTAARSLEHWSEDGRRGMDAFYALAHLDYRLLAKALDHPRLFREVRERAGNPESLSLLDVACGSGKFPAALLRDTAVPALADEGLRVDYALLDPSAFSIAEAAAELRPPFHEAQRLETTLEDLDPSVGPFDVVWATHALYALEPAHLQAAARRLVAATAPHGVALIAQGTADGHYLAFYRAFLEGVRGGEGTPYVSCEELVEAIGIAVKDGPHEIVVRRLSYDHVVAQDDRDVVEGFLQRCAFDDSVSLEQMLDAPVLGDYLAGCRDDAAGVWRFHQEVDLVLLTPGETR